MNHLDMVESCMLSHFYRSCLSAVLALMLTGLTPAAAWAEDELVITPAIKSILDQYLNQNRPLAFAVSADGTRAHLLESAQRTLSYRRTPVSKNKGPFMAPVPAQIRVRWGDSCSVPSDPSQR
ncbi:MAG: hypothetical protein ACREEE_06415 [Dongiaceae bacterium]